jgi:glycosyltransferase involved in cell wall biosynthesis
MIPRKIKLAILIPCYNEEGAIAAVIEDFRLIGNTRCVLVMTDESHSVK